MNRFVRQIIATMIHIIQMIRFIRIYQGKYRWQVLPKYITEQIQGYSQASNMLTLLTPVNFLYFSTETPQATLIAMPCDFFVPELCH